MVDAVIREWIKSQLEETTAGIGVGDQICQLLVVFYADDGLVQSRNPVFLQKTLGVLVALFKCVGLRIKTTNTERMVCIQGCIRTLLS